MYESFNEMLAREFEKKDSEFQRIFSDTIAIKEDFAMTQQELARKKISKAHE